MSCNYQFLGNSANGGYYFRLVAANQPSGGDSRTSVGLFTDSLRIFEGLRLILDKAKKGFSYGQYSGKSLNYSDRYYETKEIIYKGELLIKRLDSINQIVSGTFWFDGVNGGGQKVEIREGRFDVRYTK